MKAYLDRPLDRPATRRRRGGVATAAKASHVIGMKHQPVYHPPMKQNQNMPGASRLVAWGKAKLAELGEALESWLGRPDAGTRQPVLVPVRVRRPRR